MILADRNCKWNLLDCSLKETDETVADVRESCLEVRGQGCSVTGTDESNNPSSGPRKRT